MTLAPTLDRRSLLALGAAGASAGVGQTVMLAGTQSPGAAADLSAPTIQAAYDRVAAAGGGVLLLPPGRHRAALNATTRAVQIVGAGRGVTVLQPATAGAPAIRLLDTRGDWTTMRLADLSIEGDPALNSDGVVCGHRVYRHEDEYAGRIAIERVGFRNLDRCIVRPFGNLGVYVDDCTFAAANVQLWSQDYAAGGAEMHAGCLQVTRSHFTGFRRAMAYFASGQALSGQVNFSDCVFEAGSGFVFYVDGFRSVGAIPSFSVTGCWNEDTATDALIRVAGGSARKPRFIYARNCSAPIVLRDTPPGPVELAASQVATEHCALDGLTDAIVDGRSQLLHRDARQGSGTAPGLCLSITGPTGDTGLHTPWFRMPLPGATSLAYADAVRLCSDGDSPVALGGSPPLASRAIAGAAALPSGTRCQQLTIPAGRARPLGPLFAAAGGRWLASMFIYRTLAGSADLFGSGDRGFSGMARLAAGGWECLVNLSFDAGTTRAQAGLFVTAQEPTTLQIGGLAVLEFASRQEAIAFANAGLFPS